MIYNSVIETIGNTPIIKLNKAIPGPTNFMLKWNILILAAA